MTQEEDQDAPIVPRDALATALVFGHLGTQLYRDVAAVRGVWCDAVAVAHELWGVKEGALRDELEWRFADNVVPPLVERSVQFDPDRVLKVVDATAETFASLVESLPQLKRLHLMVANLNDESISHLVKLKEIDHFELSNPHGLTCEGFPQLASNWKSLRQLVLHNIDGFDDSWMPAIGSMVQLEHLEATFLPITKSSATHLSKLTRLRTLKLYCCPKATDEDFAEVLPGLNSLEWLEVSFCSNMGKSVLRQAAALASLKRLDLRGWGRLDQKGLIAFQSLQSLTHFATTNLSLPEEDIFYAIGGMRGLESLAIHRIMSWTLTDELMVHLSNLPLKQLSLENFTLDPIDPLPSLGRLKELESLKISAITNPVAVTVGKLHKLNCLEVEAFRSGPELDKNRLSDIGVGFIAAGCAMLEQLQITLGTKADVSAKSISGLHFLKELTLRFSPISDTGMDALCNMIQLERLDVGTCTQISADGMRHLSKLVNLEYLDIASTSIDDEGFRGLHGLLKLEDVQSSNVAITMDAFEGIDKMLSLNSLDLCGTNVGRTGIARLRNNPKLRDVLHDDTDDDDEDE